MILCREEFAKAINSNIFPGIQGGPLMHVIAAKAVALKEAMEPQFKSYAEQVVKNARALAATLVDEGFKLVSGGTDNHLMLLDFTGTELTGKVAEAVLEEAGITVNKNAVPFDTRSPFVTSGIRIGTPASTTRGLKEPEMQQVGRWIAKALNQRESQGILAEIRQDVRALCSRFPLYAHRLER
jgi:glycine hydroxymethyltransferase